LHEVLFEVQECQFTKDILLSALVILLVLMHAINANILKYTLKEIYILENVLSYHRSKTGLELDLMHSLKGP